MAKFTIKNLTANPVHLGDFYTTIQPGATIVLTNRSADELPGLSSVQKQIVAGAISLLVEYTDDEKSSGMLSPPEAIGAEDDAPVAAAAVPAPCASICSCGPAAPGWSSTCGSTGASAMNCCAWSCLYSTRLCAGLPTPVPE